MKIYRLMQQVDEKETDSNPNKNMNVVEEIVIDKPIPVNSQVVRKQI